MRKESGEESKRACAKAESEGVAQHLIVMLPFRFCDVKLAVSCALEVESIAWK